MAEKPKVAIACQGGGSHAAFAAGALSELLSPQYFDQFELVALSGTSGGAICAALAWAGLAAGGAEDARRRLFGFWDDVKADDPMDAAVNFWAVTLARLPVTAEISPYSYGPVAEPKMRELLERHLKLASLPPAAERRPHPHLLLGATEILTGNRIVFDDGGLTDDKVIASAAIPPLYRAVRIGDGRYWDGLFACNPPIREFTGLPSRPDEIWVVQINPQRRATEPLSIHDITDRRNELAGNLSLAQELFFIHKINQLIAQYGDLALQGRYKPIKLRVVELDIPDLDYPSKLDRTPQFIEKLMARGAESAGQFFQNASLWPRKGSLPMKSAYV
jgi:NTE family protein